jgi:hypothetical protein
MLTTRSSKRDKVGAFNTDLMFDVLDEGICRPNSSRPSRLFVPSSLSGRNEVTSS